MNTERQYFDFVDTCNTLLSDCTRDYEKCKKLCEEMGSTHEWLSATEAIITILTEDQEVVPQKLLNAKRIKKRQLEDFTDQLRFTLATIKSAIALSKSEIIHLDEMFRFGADRKRILDIEEKNGYVTAIMKRWDELIDKFYSSLMNSLNSILDED